MSYPGIFVCHWDLDCIAMLAGKNAYVRRLCNYLTPARLAFAQTCHSLKDSAEISIDSTSEHSHRRTRNKLASRWSCQFSTVALVRGVPASFGNCLTMEPLAVPINLQKAREQHAAYVAVLRGRAKSILIVLFHPQKESDYRSRYLQLSHLFAELCPKGHGRVNVVRCARGSEPLGAV